MTLTEATLRVQKLRKEIELHATSYYVHDAPSVSDEVYDSLVRELKTLEREYPTLLDPNFIIYRVGGIPLDVFEKVTHQLRMLSLNDAFSYEELELWEKRIQRLLPGKKFEYFCELKMDGLASSLIYENGILTRAVTRGDGFIGEDITQNVKTIQSVPLTLVGKNIPSFIEVRGEIVMAKSTLAMLNAKYAKLGKQLLANTRNAAAGSVRQLDPRVTRERRLDFFAWDIARIEGREFSTHAQAHALARELGFATAPYEAIVGTLTQAEDTIETIKANREDYAYGTDGVVIQVNDISLHKTLGVVGKAPRYAVAYKYPAEQVTTTVTSISVQVGRTGVLTPLAHFTPALVAGSTVSKATLHNIDQINRLDLRIGDTVILQKAGDVIPEIVEVIKSLRSGKEKKFTMPKSCPECGAVVTTKAGATKEETVAYYCTNDECPAKHTRGIIHFVHMLDIYEVGPKLVEKLQDEGLITDAADLFALTEGDLSGLERLGEKSAKNIVDAITDKKHPALDRFIASLGIEHVGVETARDIALHFGSFDKFWEGTPEEFDSIPNIGPAVVESIRTFRAKKSSIHIIEKLQKYGVAPVGIKKVKGGSLEGKSIVLTGTLPTLSREEAKSLIQGAGGKVVGSVSKATSFVLAGENPGSKFTEAEKLGIEIIDEVTFLKRLK